MIGFFLSFFSFSYSFSFVAQNGSPYLLQHCILVRTMSATSRVGRPVKQLSYDLLYFMCFNRLSGSLSSSISDGDKFSFTMAANSSGSM